MAALSDSSTPQTTLSDAALADRTGAASGVPPPDAPLPTLARDLVLILVRHGETTFNADGRIQGHLDVPLSEVGRLQAARLGHRLAASWRERPPLIPSPAVAAYSSDLVRAFTTAEVALSFVEPSHRPPLVRTPLLRERSFGAWQGLTAEEIRVRRAAGETEPPGGESERDVWERMGAALGLIAEEQAAMTSDDPVVVLVFGHGGSLRALVAQAVGAGIDSVRAFRLDNVGLSVVRFTPVGRGSVERVNDTAHLLDPAVLAPPTGDMIS